MMVEPWALSWDLHRTIQEMGGKGDYKVLYPTRTMIGRNRAFIVADADDIAKIKKDVEK